MDTPGDGEGAAVAALRRPVTPRNCRDQELLVALQGDGRATRLELAHAVGLTVHAVAGRLRRLEDDGLVRGYRADVAPEAFGIGLQAFVVARLHAHDPSDIDIFERAVLNVPAVVSCHRVIGSFDYVLRLAVHDTEHLGRLLRREMTAVGAVSRLETLVVLSEVKADAGWPVFDDAGLCHQGADSAARGQ
jgi:Lrp/AsnC family leucine-responsive transcriptional regulator